MYRWHGFHLLIVLAVLASLSGSSLAAEDATWKVGTAKARLIPESPDWLVGHHSHKHPVGRKLHELWTKALALEAADGRRAVIVTNDLLILQKGMYENICGQLKAQCDLDRSQIMLNCSHTHAGPMLEGPLDIILDLDDAGRARLAEYSRIVEKTIVETVVESLVQMTPATVWAGQGTCGFAVNRRNNSEKDVPDLRRRVALKGPVDHSVPVLAVRTPNGSLRAVLFIYACHATTYKCDQWSGDYPGFAQIAVEQAHPGVQAMFCQGCGADQNPLPRRTPELCEKYGKTLAEAVEAVLGKPMRPLKPHLDTAFEFVDLEFEQLPTRADLQAAAKKTGYWQHWANHFLEQLDRGTTFSKSYPCFPVQVWKLGDDQLWIALGGEAVVDYALNLKAKHGSSAWVTTYNHEMMAYIPSRRVWQEGGYESGAFAVYGLPASRWGSDIEQRIAAGVERLVNRLK